MNHFYGKSYLKEIDFNKKELEYLVDFALHLKDLKKKNIPHKYLENKILLFCSKRHRPERGLPLPLQPMIWAHTLNSWAFRIRNSAIRNPLPILLKS